MNESFLFVSNDVEFEETGKGATLVATVLELEKISGNDRFYKIEEGESIAKSLEGKPVYYGTDSQNKHDNPLVKPTSKKDPVGFVESAQVLGNKIKAIIRILSNSLINKLKDGIKFLFSVGGNAISETIKNMGGKVIHILNGAKCNHLQILDPDTPVGFPNAVQEKVLEINETIMVVGKEEEVNQILKYKETEEDIEITGPVAGFEYEER